MKVQLLDVSVLFALIYDRHVRHDEVLAWFERSSPAGWATCAMTQMSVMRLLSSSFAPDLNLSVASAAEFVKTLGAHPHHRFWTQDVIPTSNKEFDWEWVLTMNQFPDMYLLALARQNAGVLVTLDRRINLRGVVGAGAADLIVL